MNIWQRIAALEHDIEQARRDAKLEPEWARELRIAREQAKHIHHWRPVPRDGVDYSAGAPSPGALVRAHATFVVRYIDSGSGKDLGHVEAEDMSHADIDLVVVKETAAGFMAEDAEHGGSSARVALAAAHAVGMPHGRPVYFAHDEEGNIEPAVRFLRNAIDATSVEQVGAYGGIDFIEAAHHAGVRYLWQTLAWSRGEWSPHAQLRQIINGRWVGGVEVDIDRAVAADFGQWRI